MIIVPVGTPDVVQTKSAGLAKVSLRAASCKTVK